MHTNIVQKVDEANINDSFENVDGVVMNLKNVALVPSLTDCQGILLYDSKKKAIGNIHSRWKGTLHRIIEKAVQLMINEYQSDPKDLEVYICPSILKCCFEVDKEVKDLFEAEFKDLKIFSFIREDKEKKKYYIDTIEINKEILLKNGLLKKNLYI